MRKLITKSIGRPSSYKPEVALEILRRMAGGETLTSICEAKGMPSHSTVRLWAVEDREGFSALYARAREAQAHAIAEAALDGALAAKDPALGRLQFDARRWYAGKMMPRLYGDKADPTPGTAADPMVLLIQEVQGRALMPVQIIPGEAEEE